MREFLPATTVFADNPDYPTLSDHTAAGRISTQGYFAFKCLGDLIQCSTSVWRYVNAQDKLFINGKGTVKKVYAFLSNGIQRQSCGAVSCAHIYCKFSSLILGRNAIPFSLSHPNVLV